MHYMWDKHAMQVLTQAVRADVRMLRKLGEHNLTITEYQTISSNDAYEAMLRYARRFAQTEKDALLMLSVCASLAADEVNGKTVLLMIGLMLIGQWLVSSAYLYVLMPAVILLDIYILYAAMHKKRRLRRMWSHAKSSGLPDAMYNELISMEFAAQKPILLCIPLETITIFVLIAAYLAWIRTMFI